MKRMKNILSFFRLQFEHKELFWDWYITKGWQKRQKQQKR